MSLPQLKPVQVSHKASVSGLGSDVLAVIVDEDQIADGKIKAAALSNIDKDLGNTISELVSLGDFKGSWLEVRSTLLSGNSAAKRLLLVGAGKKEDRAAARTREIGMKIGEFTSARKLNKVAIQSTSRHTQGAEALVQAALGTSYSSFKYPVANQSPEAKADMETPCEVTLISETAIAADAISKAQSLMDATSFCRYLQDAPPNIGNPKAVADWAKGKADKLGLKTTIHGRAELEKMGFGGMLAVSAGSAHEPQFVVIEYTPEKYEKTIAFVGKGLTMDSGGYSLKPSASQVSMQYDMSGAAITLSSVLPIAEQKLPVRVFAIAALCENMVDAHAYRVNDVITTYAGKTVEIKNTDAEGRVVLCDALAYTSKEIKPDMMFEYSTLTGAIVVALGGYGAGVFSHPNEKPADVVRSASDASGERVWELPVWEEAVNDIKSSGVADLCNIGATAGSAGSSTAAAYLFEFVGDTPYAHIDVAGVAFNAASIGHPRKTGSGFGVQLNLEIAKSFSK